MNSELVFVAAGQQLSPPSSWRSDCPTDWASACRGDDSTTPTTTPTTTAPPTTTPPTTTPTTTPPTTTPATTTTTTVDPGPAEITVTAGTESLLVAHRIPAATKYQVRYRAAGAKRVWTPPTALTQQRIDGLSPGVPVTVEVRGLIRGVWRSWTALTGTPTGGQTTTTTTPTTTTTTPSTGGPTGTVTTSATRYGPALTLDPGNLKIDATWSHPTATKYQLNYRPVGGDWVRSPPTTDVSAALSGLSNGTVYEVRVRAYVSKVWRPWTKLATTVGT